MGIGDLLDTPPTGTPVPRLTQRAPVSVKELIGIATLAALAWGAYDHLNKFAEKTAVEHLSDTMWQQRIETQHNFDTIRSQLDQLVKAQERSDLEKHQAARK
jgi:hypothetical protein